MIETVPSSVRLCTDDYKSHLATGFHSGITHDMSMQHTHVTYTHDLNAHMQTQQVNALVRCSRLFFCPNGQTQLKVSSDTDVSGGDPMEPDGGFRPVGRVWAVPVVSEHINSN